jgi:hypothetical protein
VIKFLLNELGRRIIEEDLIRIGGTEDQGIVGKIELVLTLWAVSEM